MDKEITMIYKDYVRAATADGYPLRYYRIKRRLPALAAMAMVVLVLLTMIRGCDLVHAAVPSFPYRLLEMVVAILFVVFFLAVARLVKPRRAGYVDLTEDELLFLDAELNITRRIMIADLAEIWNTGDPDHGLERITSRGRALKLTLKYRNGTLINIECVNQPFFPEHEKMYVPAGYLLDHLRRRGGNT